MQAHDLPKFSAIDIENFSNKLSDLLQHHLTCIDALLAKNIEFTWDNLMHPLEDLDDSLHQLWAPFAHLNAVTNSTAIRDCYLSCLPKLSMYESKVGHNEALYQAIRAIDQTSLNATQLKIINDTLRDFKLSGIALSAKQKQRFADINTQLSEFSCTYENHIMDAVDTFFLHITDEQQLQGLPSHVVTQAKHAAETRQMSGFVLTIESPCYIAVSTHADDRSLRESCYEAYITKASDVGPLAGKFDNSAIMHNILALRAEQAEMLGFPHYAAMSLATKMAKSPEEVMTFLYDLADKAFPQAVEEFQALQKFAATHYQIDAIKPWDIAYLSEKKMQAEYAISQEELRTYFPLSHVLDGMFNIVNRLYGMRFERLAGADIWHADVRCYAVFDETNTPRGYVYLDLFARPQKRGGAWMDDLRGRRRCTNGTVQLPIATLTCNFSAPMPEKEATLLHDEVITLFHELGHCLQHILTQVDYLGASGMNGVEWDAVELPSQFFENWCWDEEALSLLARHSEHGGGLSHALYQKLLSVKNFQAAMAMVRQLEFSLFDFRLHLAYQPGDQALIANILQEVRSKIAVVPVVPYNRFQHAFSHIFAGGYAAGYYSYKWAEVLSSDAFARFEEEGVFNQQTGREFLHSVLEVGGSVKAADAFMHFRKRAPKIDALLKHSGILVKE